MNKLTLLVVLLFLGFNNLCYGQCSSGQTTTSFSFTGAIEQFTVPTGVTSITMIVTGADGGGNTTSNGGSGGTVSATFAVVAGEVLDIVVGEAGSSTTATGTGDGGGGGGGSAVRRNTSNNILLNAGAGGGAGLGGGGGGNLFANLPSSSPTHFGAAGETTPGGSDGGFGASRGRAGFPQSSVNAGGSGGGSINGPIGANFAPSFGGFYYINPINISSDPVVQGVDGGGMNANGSVVFCYNLPQQSIPTMSQWGLIIFGLLIMNLGLVFLSKKEKLLS